MTRNILILNEKKCDCEILNKIIYGLEADVVVKNAHSTAEAFQIIFSMRIHVFIIDIVLNNIKSGDVSGLYFAEEIRRIEKYKYTPIIFISHHEDPMLLSYSRLHCYDYIEKPFSVYRLTQSVLGAIEIPIISDDNRCIFLRKDGLIFAQKIKDIVYIRAKERKLMIFSTKKYMEIPYKTLDEILCEIDMETFVRCSRSTIVNTGYIEYIDFTNRYIKMLHCDELIEIGSVVMKEFRSRFA